MSSRYRPHSRTAATAAPRIAGAAGQTARAKPVAVLRRVVLRVVDHVVSAEGSHEVEVLGVANRGDLGSEVFGQLDAGRADASRGAVDQHLAPVPAVRQAQAPVGAEEAVADGRRLLEASARRHRRDPGPLLQALVLGVAAEAKPGVAEDAVADRELGDRVAGHLHRTGPETSRLMSMMPTPLLRLASRVWQSKRLTVEAWIRTRTSSAAGVGRSTSTIRRIFGGP